jgi:hypothetical protein
MNTFEDVLFEFRSILLSPPHFLVHIALTKGIKRGDTCILGFVPQMIFGSIGFKKSTIIIKQQVLLYEERSQALNNYQKEDTSR